MEIDKGMKSKDDNESWTSGRQATGKEGSFLVDGEEAFHIDVDERGLPDEVSSSRSIAYPNGTMIASSSDDRHGRRGGPHVDNKWYGLRRDCARRATTKDEFWEQADGDASRIVRSEQEITDGCYQ